MKTMSSQGKLTRIKEKTNTTNKNKDIETKFVWGLQEQLNKTNREICPVNQGHYIDERHIDKPKNPEKAAAPPRKKPRPATTQHIYSPERAKNPDREILRAITPPWILWLATSEK